MRRSRGVLWTSVACVASLGLALGLYWFQPWKLFVDHRVDEALPAVAVQSPVADESSRPATDPATAPSHSTRPTQPTPPTRPTAVLLSRGDFISHEHSTSGTASIVRQPDGSRVLAIAGLNTSDGPDVKVWLTDASVIRGSKGWHVFDDGAHVSLGGLKGNLGNQLYQIPEEANLAKLTSVSIWCDRFDVSFGAAALVPA